MKVTAETITEDMIRELCREFAGTGTGDRYHHAAVALGLRRPSLGKTQAASRARCAEIWNARMPS